MCPIDIRCKRDNEKTKMVVISGMQTPAADFSHLFGFPVRAFEG